MLCGIGVKQLPALLCRRGRAGSQILARLIRSAGILPPDSRQWAPSPLGLVWAVNDRLSVAHLLERCGEASAGCRVVSVTASVLLRTNVGG